MISVWLAQFSAINSSHRWQPLRVPIKPTAEASESTGHNEAFEVATPTDLLTLGSRHKAFIASHGY